MEESDESKVGVYANKSGINAKSGNSAGAGSGSKAASQNAEPSSQGSIQISKTKIWQGISAVLGILLIASVTYFMMKDDAGVTGRAVSGVGDATAGKLPAIIISDKRCGSDCDVTTLVAQLKNVFPSIEIKEVDYSDSDGKEIYEKNSIRLLPAVLFTEEIKTQTNYNQVEPYLDNAGSYISLRIGASFDPNAEICDNNVDDTGDGKIDCDDSGCSGDWKCMEKKDKPEIELFVMSHCPYGTQVEKGFLPVLDLLGEKVDFKVKFCDYAMHGKNELDEENRQYCIQKEQPSLFIGYLKCFLKEGKSDECVTEAKVDKAKLDSCVKATDEKFRVSASFADKSTYKGSFPSYTVFQEDVDKYDVGGSPTLIINGVTANVGRDPASLLDAVCTGFKEKPAECSEKLSSATPAPGFGFDEAASAASAGSCV